MSRRKRELKLDEQLSSVPVRNTGVRVHDGPDGSRVIEVQLIYAGWMKPLTKLLRTRTFRRYRLDGVGLGVYEMIDGEKSFERLIDEFAAMHKLTFFESRALLVQYLRLLMKNGIIVVRVAKRR